MVLWPRRGKTYYAVVDYWEKFYVMRVTALRAGLRTVQAETDECGIHEEEPVTRRRLYRTKKAAVRACAILNAGQERNWE